MNTKHKIKKNVKQDKWTAIENVAIVLSYTAIAIMTGKWWVILFSIFSLITFKLNKKEN